MRFMLVDSLRILNALMAVIKQIQTLQEVKIEMRKVLLIIYVRISLLNELNKQHSLEFLSQK